MDEKLSRELKFVQKVGQLKTAVLEKYETQELRENTKYIINEVFGIDIADDIKTAVGNIVSNLKNDNLELEINNIERIKQTNYNYKVNNQDTIKAINLCLAAGLPVNLFEHAEILFNQERAKQDKKNKYMFNGTDIGSYFAAYLAVIKNKTAVIFNGPGLANLTAFTGNEFLGVKKGIEYFLNDILEDSRKIESIIVGLNELGVLKSGNISSKYRKNSLEINSSAVKKAVITVLVRELGIEYEKASELVKENFNSKLINRKMRFIDRHKIYLQRKQGDKDQIINYIMSDNIPVVIFDDIGATFLVDKNFKTENPGLTEGLIKRISKIKKDKIKLIINQSLDNFEPYFCLAEEGNGRTAKNHLANKPEVGDISSNLSLDYLSALIKDIILDLNKKDKKIVIELFKRSRQGHSGQFVEIIKDRLRYSMKLQGKLGSTEDNNIFRSKFFRKNPNLLTDKDKVYVLDQAVLEQFERMSFFEIESLYSWELTGKGIELILCEKQEGDENKNSSDTSAIEAEQENSDQVITYHSSDSALKFDNQEKRLKLECKKPSQNRIYGSLKQNRYIDKRDNEYLVEEDEIYQFNNTQGVGFEIFSAYTKADRLIKINGQSIDKEYQEKDRDEVDIGNRTKTLKDIYFGENIILRDKKTTYGQLSGDLIYIYGPQKEDELIIEGFQNGDYGIKLREKVRQKGDDKQAVTYTAYHKIRFDSVEFVDLKELVIEKSIYEHSKVKIAGVIKDENAEKYRDYLEKEADPRIIITYDDDDSKILFKGIINDYNIDYKYFNYYLELKAVSYTVLLDRERHSRVYQNLGTSYNQVCQKLSTSNEKFNINFANSSEGEVPLVSEQYPLVLQYKETDWEFISRIASYLDKVLVVDDSKDDSETINIQVGFHTASAVELNNDNWAKCKDTGPKNIIYHYYKVYEHEHFRSDHVFEVGKKVELIIDHKNNTTVEMGIIKNKIYLQKGILYSELTLAREESIKILNKQRKFLMEGRSYRAEVKEVNQQYQAKVCFIDIEDDYQADKAHWFSIDKPYTAAYSSPDIGDIVDIYFKNKNEKHATLKSSTTDEAREIEQDPLDKTITTPGGYTIKLNNGLIYIFSPEEEAVLEIDAEAIKMTSSDNQAVIKKGEIELKTKKGYGRLSKTGSEIGFGGRKVEINNGKVKFI